MAIQNCIVLERHRSFSRVDMTWILKKPATNVREVEMFQRLFQSMIQWVWFLKESWRLDEMLLQKEKIVENYEKKLKYFLENNLNKGINIRMANKAIMRRYFMQCYNEL